jgi:hypothetical protein
MKDGSGSELSLPAPASQFRLSFAQVAGRTFSRRFSSRSATVQES